MKKLSARWLGLLSVLVCGTAFAQNGPPPFPSQFFGFPPNFETGWTIEPPLAYTTNLISEQVDVPGLWGDALILDTTNLSPAYLEYYVIDTNFNANLSYGTGTILFLFAPNWASVSQGGTGPGETAYFLSAGDTSTNGSFAVYADACGSNIFFGGVSNGVSLTYASAPISWTSNTFHEIGIEYTAPSPRHRAGTSTIYLDGAVAATGNGESIIPWLGIDTNGFYTNAFYIGSDANGKAQARGAFLWFYTWTEAYWDYSPYWPAISNAIVAWQATLGGGGFGGMMGMSGLGSLNPTNNGCGCISNATVHLTNIAAAEASGPDMTFTFTVEGGIMGIPYDIFTTTNFVGSPATNSIWTWLGQGTNCGTYFVINQAATASFYILGGTNLASDGSGFTAAYEQLVASDGFGTPNAWYFAQGLNPHTSGIGTNDLNGSGLLNWQDYLDGNNPQVSQTFSVWVSEPNGTSGIP